MAEYDELGQDAFLDRYGYRRSRIYRLVEDGRSYDSKAIVGAAHRFIGPEFDALKPSEFSGGAATVARKLRSLGFEIREATPAESGWTEEERLLALDLYLRHGVGSATDQHTIALSEELNRRAFHPDAGSRPDFRNANGVNLKLANFAALDPGYDGAGMSSTSIGDEITCERYAGDCDLLSEAVATIRRGEPLPSVSAAETVGDLVEVHEVEPSHIAEYEVTRDAATATARRTEAQLVLDFTAWLRSIGHQVTSHHYTVVSPPLRTDAVDETEHRIWEAKAEPSRASVRMAIGQLFDYRRHETTAHSIGVLLPRAPSADLLDLITSTGAQAAWRSGGDDPPFVIHGETG